MCNRVAIAKQCAESGDYIMANRSTVKVLPLVSNCAPAAAATNMHRHFTFRSAFHIQKRRTRRFVQVATAIALYQSVRPAVTVMVVTFSVAAGADADCRTRYSLATLNNVSILCPFSPEAMVIASIAHEPR